MLLAEVRASDEPADHRVGTHVAGSLGTAADRDARIHERRVGVTLRPDHDVDEVVDARTATARPTLASLEGIFLVVDGGRVEDRVLVEGVGADRHVPVPRRVLVRVVAATRCGRGALAAASSVTPARRLEGRVLAAHVGDGYLAVTTRVERRE